MTRVADTDPLYHIPSIKTYMKYNIPPSRIRAHLQNLKGQGPPYNTDSSGIGGVCGMIMQPMPRPAESLNLGALEVRLL